MTALFIFYLLLALAMFIAADIVLGAWRYVRSEQFIRDCRAASEDDDRG